MVDMEKLKMNSNNTSATLAQTILATCPVSCMILDEQGKITYVNHSFEEIFGIDQSSILGADQSCVPRDDLKDLFSNDSEVVIRETSGATRTFKHSQQKIKINITDGFEIHYFLEQADDVLRSNNAQLHEELSDLRLGDSVTGLSTERALMMALESQVSRSRRYNNPLSIVRIFIEFDEKTMASDDSCKQCQLTVSRLLKDQLRWADVIGQLSSREFVIVLPETDESSSNAMAGKLSENLVRLDGVESALFGITEWKKGDTAVSMLHRVEEGLTQAQQKDELSAAVL